jgi:hypothetical protein
MCLRFFVQRYSETFLIVRKIRQDVIIKLDRSSCKLPEILVRFYSNFIFLNIYSIKPSNIYFSENLSNGSRSGPCLAKIDRTKVIVVFRNFANSPPPQKKLKFEIRKIIHFIRNKITLLIQNLMDKVNQSHYRPEVPRGFQEVKVPRLRDNGPGWW